MAKSVIITVKEPAGDLKALYSKAPVHLRPRYKMLILIAGGCTSSQELAAKTGTSRNSIAKWKQVYNAGGLDQLSNDQRGGDFISDISAADKKKIENKLSAPKNAFTSFGQAQAWLKEELGIDTIFVSPDFPEIWGEDAVLVFDSIKVVTQSRPVPYSNAVLLLSIARSTQDLDSQLGTLQLYLFICTSVFNLFYYFVCLGVFVF